MVSSHIRMNNMFVYKKNNKYFLTTVNNKVKWSKMSDSEKESCKGTDITSQVKSLLRKHGSKYNMNFKTNSSKKKIRTRRNKLKGG